MSTWTVKRGIVRHSQTTRGNLQSQTNSMRKHRQYEYYIEKILKLKSSVHSQISTSSFRWCFLILFWTVFDPFLERKMRDLWMYKWHNFRSASSAQFGLQHIKVYILWGVDRVHFAMTRRPAQRWTPLYNAIAVSITSIVKTLSKQGAQEVFNVMNGRTLKLEAGCH